MLHALNYSGISILNAAAIHENIVAVKVVHKIWSIKFVILRASINWTLTIKPDNSAITNVKGVITFFIFLTQQVKSKDTN